MILYILMKNNIIKNNFQLGSSVLNLLLLGLHLLIKLPVRLTPLLFLFEVLLDNFLFLLFEMLDAAGEGLRD